MINLSRRGFATLLAALPLTATLSTGARAESTGPLPRLPVTARYRIGRFEVTVISDGYIDFPFEMFIGVTPEQVQAAVGRPSTLRASTGKRRSFSTWLINDGERLVLAGQWSGRNGQRDLGV